MTRIGMQFDQSFSHREIQLLLHTLSSDSHRRSDLGSGLWFSGQGDGTQYLPTRTRQSERLNQPVSLFQ